MKTLRLRHAVPLLAALAASGCAPDADPGAATLAAVTSAAWTPEAVVGTSALGVLRARTAINGAGVAVAVWDDRLTATVTRVWASVYAGGAWTPPRALSDGAVTAASATPVVAPSGAVTVLWETGGGAWSADCVGGVWSASVAVPSEPGYGHIVGAGVDGAGNLELVAGALRAGSTAAYDVEAIVRTGAGVWGAPVRFASGATVASRLVMNGAGQAILHTGLTVTRSNALGVWGAPQTLALAGQVYSTSVALDAGGRGYLAARSRYGGANVSTSTATTAWTTFKRVAKFDVLGSSLGVVASSSGRALVYGEDYSTGMVRASATTNGGGAWGGLVNLGVGALVGAAGGDRGLYAVGWLDNETLRVATGTGVGTGTNAWVKAPVAGLYAWGVLAVSGTRAAAVWYRGADAGLSSFVVGAATATLTP
jgi:hypothetical protein